MNAREVYWDDEDELAIEADIESALPMVLGGEPQEWTPEFIDELVAHVTGPLTDAEAESLGNAMRDIGKWANNRGQLQQLAGAVLPVAGAAVGTFVGGPVGTAVGSTVGQELGRAINAPAQTSRAASAASGAPSGSVPAPLMAGTDGSVAASKLLYLVQNPAFLSSLVALALGSNGQRNVPIGGSDESVPVGAMLNLANTLVSQATQDADSFIRDDEGAGADSYLKSGDDYLCDPTVPTQRANVLMQLLQRADESLEDGLGFEDDDDYGWPDEWPSEW